MRIFSFVRNFFSRSDRSTGAAGAAEPNPLRASIFCEDPDHSDNRPMSPPIPMNNQPNANVGWPRLRNFFRAVFGGRGSGSCLRGDL